MADNWLEKREQQLSGGKIIYRKVNQSLEMLLNKLAAGERPAERTDPPKNAQLEAIARSAKILFPQLDLRWDEANGQITWAGHALNPQQRGGKTALTPEQTGAAILAMQLKACELGFHSHQTPDGLVIE